MIRMQASWVRIVIAAMSAAARPRAASARWSAIANALSVTLTDGTALDEVRVDYPIGHRRRRADGLPLLEAKFRANLARRFQPARQQAILAVSLDQATLEAMPVPDYVDLYVP